MSHGHILVGRTMHCYYSDGPWIRLLEKENWDQLELDQATRKTEHSIRMLNHSQ